MQRLRLRFTIGRLMIAVLVAGVMLSGALTIRARLRPTIAEAKAQAFYRRAMLAREVAEITLKEYQQGIYPQDKVTYQGQVALAYSDLERASDRLKWSSEMLTKGLVSRATNISDKLTKQQAEFDLEQAQTQLKVLEKYTKDKQMKSLTSDIEKARADEQAKLAAYRFEQSKRWRIFGF